MRKLLLAIAMLCAIPASGTSYFISPTGNDGNAGTSSGSPWLTPNHATNCGDTITAASGTYAAANFASGKWGTVTCVGGNNVTWLICGTFDACKISSSGTQAMEISNNYWGVQGWEVTGSGTNAACYEVRPVNTSTSLHHIIFANNVANACYDGGFDAVNNGAAGVDYIVYIGNIAYNAAKASDSCASGFNIYQPKKSDSVAGTHMYVAGNFAWSNLNPDPCAGGIPTDGEGIILDTFDGSQGSGNDYDQQAVVQNNISIGNGGRGILILNNQSGATHAAVYVEYNTTWDNDIDPNQNGGGSYGDLEMSRSNNTTFSNNLVATNAATCCGGFALYGIMVNQGGSSDTVTTNWAYSAAGNNVTSQSSAGFSFGSNTTGSSPAFTSASVPGAPSCGSSSSVPGCMSTVISNFKPTASGSTVYGYQIPLGYSITDPLFPAWLCNVNLPSGLVTLGCGAPPTLGSSVGGNVSTGGGTSIQ